MKCNPWRWLWGLPLVAMLAWITILGERPRIEKDLTDATQSALNAAGLGWAKPSFEGRDATILGRALSEKGAKDVIDIVDSVPGVRITQSRVDLADRADPYTWGAQFKESAVKLTGYAPDDKVKTSILTATKSAFPDAKIEDEMQIARGVPERDIWISGVEFALKQLGALTHGQANLSGTTFSISGETRDFATYKGLKQALSAGLPSGIKLAEASINPPRVSPFTWQARRTANQLVITGHVPNEKLRDELFALAKERLPDAAIVDRTEVARGAPDGFAKAARACIVSGLSGVESGQCALNENRLTISGKAKDIAEAKTIIAGLSTEATSFKIQDKLTYPDPAPPAVSPYVTNIERTGSIIELSGFVPDKQSREDIIALVGQAYPDRSLLNRLELGSGASEGWRTCIAAGIKIMPKLTRSKLGLKDRQLTLSGATDDEAAVERIAAELRAGANRACETDARIELDVVPEPRLNWRAVRSPVGDLTLSGEVPDEAARTVINEQAKTLFPKATIVDNMQVQNVDARKWSQVAAQGLKMLASLRSGTAAISGHELSLSGDAPDTAVFGALKDRLGRGFVGGFKGRHDLKVRSDAMIWAEQEAAKKAQQEQLAKEAEEKRQSELARAAAEKARAAEEEQARVEAAAAEKARAAEEQARVEAAAAEKAREAEEQARAEALAKQRAQQEAKAKAQAEAAEAKRQAEALAERTREADKCQQLLTSAAASGVIRFRTARFELRSSSKPTIRRLADIANQCPGFQIVIEGHTDSQGTDENNLALSQKRAQSVVDYLIEAGVDQARLKAVGYGEAKPLVPNTSLKNMARNRRIEFKVLVN